MKSLLLVLASLMATAASADAVQLSFIDTDNCSLPQREIALLNNQSAGITVTTSCAQGPFQDQNGRVYAQRVYTTVNVNASVYAGMTLQMAPIYTNDTNCAYSANEIPLLNSGAVTVQTYCSGPSYYQSNGNSYSYALYTTLTVN